MTYLYKIRKTYYFRIRIPIDLRVCFGGKEDFKRSLHTTDLKNAQKLIRAWGYHAERNFTLMRSGFMTKDQIKNLADQFFRQTLEEIEESRAQGVRTVCPRNEDEREAYLDALSYGASDMRESLASQIKTSQTFLSSVYPPSRALQDLTNRRARDCF